MSSGRLTIRKFMVLLLQTKHGIKNNTGELDLNQVAVLLLDSVGCVLIDRIVFYRSECGVHTR